MPYDCLSPRFVMKRLMRANGQLAESGYLRVCLVPKRRQKAEHGLCLCRRSTDPATVLANL